MFKNLLSITFFSVVLFFSCTKDVGVYPAHIAPEPTTAFLLQNEIYPNPCQGVFTIKTNTTDSQIVNLYDITGRQVFSLTISGTTAIVDNNLVNGVYYLSISSKYGKNTNKIIVSK